MNPIQPETGEPDRESDVVLQLTVRTGDVVEVWLRQGMTGVALAALLRRVAKGFETGHPTRIH